MPNSLALVAVLALASSPAVAEPDRGLYARVASGPGYLRMHGKVCGSRVDTVKTIDGAAANVTLSVGYSLSSTLKLSADIWFAGTVDDSHDLDCPGAVIHVGGTYSSVGAGVGATYRFAPKLDLFVAGSIGTAYVIMPTTILFASTTGLGGRVAVGKNWRLGRDLGLGVAIESQFAIANDQMDDRVSAISIGGVVTLSHR